MSDSERSTSTDEAIEEIRRLNTAIPDGDPRKLRGEWITILGRWAEGLRTALEASEGGGGKEWKPNRREFTEGINTLSAVVVALRAVTSRPDQ